VCPYFEVASLEGSFKAFRAKDMFKIPDVNRGRNEPLKESDWGWTLETYDCKGKGQKSFIDNNEARSEENKGMTVENLITEAVEVMAKKVKLAREKRVASLFMNAAAYAATNKVDLHNDVDYDPFNDFTNSSDPMQIRLLAEEATRGTINACVMGYRVANALRRNPFIRSQVWGGSKSESPLIMKDDDLAYALDVKYLFVGDAKYDNTKAITVTLSPVWGDDLLFFYLNPEAAINRREQAFAKTFVFPQDGAVEYYRVREWDEPDRGSGGTYVALDHEVDEQIIDPYLGYLVQNAYYVS
jgi:hypothetical protein